MFDPALTTKVNKSRKIVKYLENNLIVCTSQKILWFLYIFDPIEPARFKLIKSPKKVKKFKTLKNVCVF